MLGQTSSGPLSPGGHAVDFWARNGAAPLDLAHPTTHYAWTVVAGDAAVAVGDAGSLDAPLPSDAGLLVLGSLNAGQTFTSMVGSVQLLGSDQPLSSVSESAGVTGSGTITGPASLGASTLRFGKIPDPLDATRQVFYMAAKASDGVTFAHLGRVEMVLETAAAAMQKSGVTYWIASELYLPAVRWNGGDGTLLDIHNSTPPSTVYGPLALGFQTGAIFPNPGVYVNFASSTQSDPSQPGFNETDTYPWGSDNAGFPASPGDYEIAQTFGPFPRDQWVKVVFKYRGDPTGTTGLVQAWLTYGGTTTTIVDLSGITLGTAPQGYPTDYLKCGLDDYALGGGANGTWELRRSIYLFEDNGNTAADILAAMD